MPSTYTANLGVEKPGNGEQSGVWGDTVNTNMDIVDRATNGSVALTLSGATSTLTTAEGTLSDGQNKFLRLTGSPGGTHTITVAPNDAQKIYFVTNATNQSVVVSQGSGATVTILAGNAAAVYCNGAGAGAAVTSIFNALAMGAVRITGGTVSGITDLAVADGGTGASTAVAALTNLGLTATAAELNILDGVTTSTAELNYVDGVTSAIQTQINTKAALSSPTFTGVPAAPTAAAATNTTQLATTAFVTTADNLKANIAGAAFTGAISSTAGDVNLKTVTALADAAATLTAAQLLTGLFTITPTVARSLTTATGTLIAAALAGSVAGSNVAFTIVNRAAFNVTLLAGAGVTIVGGAVINNGSGTWRIRVDSPTAVTIYTEAAIAVVPPTDLLGTLTTTSGSSQTLSALNLAPYRFLRLVWIGVSATASFDPQIDGIRAGPASGSAANAQFGTIDLDLFSGVFSAAITTQGDNGSVYVGQTAYTTASTSIVISCSVGTFDGGSVRVYGIV